MASSVQDEVDEEQEEATGTPALVFHETVCNHEPGVTASPVQHEEDDKEAIGTPALCETVPVGKRAHFKLDKAKMYKGDFVQYWDKDVQEWLIGAVFHGNDESVRICVAQHPQDTMLATCFDMPQGHTDLWKIMNPTVVRKVIADPATRSAAALIAAAL